VSTSSVRPSAAPPSGEPRGHVLVVDDELDLSELLCMRLDHHGFRATAESTIRGALEVMEREMVDAMIVDLRLDGENGLDLLDAVQNRSLDLPVVVLTAHGSVETAVDAMARGAYGFLAKPFHDHELLEKIGHAVERVRLRREVAGLRRIVGEADGQRLLGTSAKIAEVRERIARVGPSDATVLVLGESGTGKELIARAVHDSSPRKERALVKVNCAALPATLIESELFGHEKGAFTGALARRIGRFELAHEGTLFLDEIGDLPLELQAKLLRVLQEGELERLGDPKTIHVDVRVIAATNQNLEDAVAAGRFRADLYYRLNVFPVTLPPLRERDDDVILLAEFFAVQSGRKLGKRVEGIAPPLRERLRSYPWPGNVRELQNVIERAVIITDAPLLAFDEPFRGPINGPSLAAAVAGRMTPVQSVASIARAAAPDPAAGGAPATLHEVEINMMRAALEACNWVVGGKQGAAARLGLPASTLRERMARYGLRKGA
jgi:two-component system response regulator GlrR